MQNSQSFELVKVPYQEGVYVSVLQEPEVSDDEFNTKEATFFKEFGSGYEKIGFIRYREETSSRTKDNLLDMACSYCESALEAINNCTVHFFEEGDIYIEEVRVCETQRGKGFGKMILNWISNISEKTNVIFLTVEYSDDGLFYFYEKNIVGYIIDGIKERTITFVKQ